MDGPEVEHRVEIQRATRTGPLWVAIVVAAVAAVVAVSRGGDAADVTPAPTTSTVPSTPTSETLTTTTPAQPVVLGVTASARGLAAFSTFHRPPPGSDGAEPAGLAPPVATQDQVAVLVDGMLLAGRPGDALEEVACCYDELHPSDESGHVWVREGDEAALVLLDGGGTRAELAVGDDRILGPGPQGLVTAGADGSVRWRRARLAPLEVHLGPGREPLDSGGRVVLASVSDDVRVRRWELRSIPDGRLVASLDARGTWPRGTRGLLSPDGRALAVPVPTGWAVRVVPGLDEVGRLSRSQPPVWIGDHRFAAVADRHVLVSDGTEVPVPDEVLALAEQSP